MKELLAKTNTARNEALARGEDAFDDDYVKELHTQLRKFLTQIAVVDPLFSGAKYNYILPE